MSTNTESTKFTIEFANIGSVGEIQAEIKKASLQLTWKIHFVINPLTTQETTKFGPIKRANDFQWCFRYRLGRDIAAAITCKAIKSLLKCFKQSLDKSNFKTPAQLQIIPKSVATNASLRNSRSFTKCEHNPNIPQNTETIERLE